MKAIMDLFTDPQSLLSMVVGLLAFATIVTLLGSIGGGVSLEKRMKAVGERREELKRRSRAAMAGPGGLRHTDEGFKKRVVDRLNLTKLLEDPKVAAPDHDLLLIPLRSALHLHGGGGLLSVRIQ